MVFVDYPDDEPTILDVVGIHNHIYSLVHRDGVDGPVAVVCLDEDCEREWKIGRAADDESVTTLIAAARGALLGGAHDGPCQEKPCPLHRKLAGQRVDALRRAVEDCL